MKNETNFKILYALNQNKKFSIGFVMRFLNHFSNFLLKNNKSISKKIITNLCLKVHGH